MEVTTDQRGRLVLADVEYHTDDTPLDGSEKVEYARLADRFLQIPYCPWTPNPGPQTQALLDFGRESLYGGAVGGSKMQPLDTPIPTPNGFVRLGDIHSGDLIIGRDGQSYAVLAESPVRIEAGWRFTFDDASTVESHDEHLWLTFDNKELAALTCRDPERRARRRATRKSRAVADPQHGELHSTILALNNQQRVHDYLPPPPGTVRSTAEIVDTFLDRRGHTNHAIPVAAPIDLPDTNLPLDPYVLGVWLGDGTARDGSVTSMDPEIIEAIVEAGFSVRRIDQKLNNRASTTFFNDLREILKSMGLVNNKHVPHEYLWSSVEQRLALLQGLMDTDGMATGAGAASFTNTNRRLVAAAAQLARSLGHKVTITERRAMLYGKDCGPIWTIKFMAKMPVFRLTRKLQRMKLATRSTTNFRYIKRVERIPAVAMKCLRVASPDHLFLCTEHFIPTHNSVGIMMEASQFLNVPGYDALLLRKTFMDLNRPGALMDLASDWWGGVAGVKFDRQNHSYRFDCYDEVGQPGFGKRQHQFIGHARIEFGAMDTENDRLKYQGGRYHFCCVGKTPIYMADGSWKPIRDVAVGDTVSTLEGSRTVTRTVNVGRKKTYRVTTSAGHSITVGAGHRILTTNGWQIVDQLAQRSIQSRGVGNTRESAMEMQGSLRPLVECSQTDQQPADEQSRRIDHRDEVLPGTVESSKDRRIDASMLCESRQVVPPLPASTVRAVLHGPALASTMSFARHCEASCGRLLSAPQDSTSDCRHGSHSCDGPLHRLPTVDRDSTLPPSDVDLDMDLGDGLGSTQERSHSAGYSYVHPYTNEPRLSTVPTVISEVQIVPADEEECFDLTVESSSHYITSGGIANGNCGYDELTQFKERDYTYLFSRQRRPTSGPTSFIPMRMRSTSNPGGPGHEWVYKRFIVFWERWMAGLMARPKRNFHPAMLKDNPHLDEEDYVASLMELDPITRAQLLRGDWNIRPDGRMFKRDWFKPIRRDEVPPNCQWVRFWDMAATDAVPGLDPDWTVGVRMGRSVDGRFFIDDVRRWRKDPGVNDEWCRHTALADTRRVVEAMEQEPGSGGKIQIHHYRTTAFATTGLRAVPASGKARGRTTTITAGRKTSSAKIMAAGPLASHADAGLVHVVVDGSWEVDEFLAEAEIFPDGDHDDQIDAAAGAINLLAKLPSFGLSLGDQNASFKQENQWRPDAVKSFNGALADMEAKVGGARIGEVTAEAAEREVRTRIEAAFAV